MSKTVDERVVEMRFDNSHFEKNVGTTMSTLDKLKQKLNFGDSSKSLDNITKAANKVDLSSIARSIEPIRVKFSALDSIANTVFANITTSAMNAGNRIVKMFAVEPVSAGFSEYELKMGSIQTIMASTGESLETVNNYLEELNEYSDKTIYSFSDMTQNIGKFTNAGVGLNDAVLAIKGISNAAALSGANAGEASRAMYNFAQALSSGYVKLIDWKSIENANMATVGFKEQLIEAAVSAGTLTKVTDGYKTAAGTVISPTKNFNDSLQDQWMTTDVLINTLRKYADETTQIGYDATRAAQDVKTFSMMMDTLKESAQSGWAQTWEIIVGDFEEAKSFFTYLTNEVFGPIIDGMSKARNDVLKAALDNEGSENKWGKYVAQIEAAGVATEDFQNALLETAKTHDKSIAHMIKDGKSFEDIMKSGKITSEMISETLWNFVDSMGEATASTVDMTEKLEDMRSVVRRVIRGDFGNATARMNALTEAGYDYAEVQKLVNKVMAGGTIELSDLSTEQLKSVGYTEEQIKALRELAEQAKNTGVPIEELVEDMNKMSGRDMIVATIMNVFKQLGKVLEKVKEAWTEVFGEFDASEALYNVIESIYNFVGTAEITTETLDGLKASFKGLFDAIWLVGTLGGGVFATLRKVLSSITYVLGFGNIWQTIGHIGGLISQFRSWLTTNNDLSQSLIDTGNKIVEFVDSVVLGVAKWVAEFSQLQIVQDFLTNIKSAISTTGAAIITWFADAGEIFKEFAANVAAIEDLSFDSFMEVFEDFASKLIGHVLGIPNVFSSIVNAVKNFAKDVAAYFGEAGGTVSSVLSDIWEKLTGFYNNVKNWLTRNVGFGEIATILIGGGLILSLLKISSTLSKMFQTVVNISKKMGGVFDALKDSINKIGDAKALQLKAEAIKTFAIAIAILAASMFVLAQLDWPQIGKAALVLVGLAGLLAALGFAFSKMAAIDVRATVNATGFLAMATALMTIVGVVKILSDIDPALLWHSVGVMTVITAVLTGALFLLDKANVKGNVNAVGLLALTGSLLILVFALEKFADFDMETLKRSVFGLIGVIAILATLSKVSSALTIGSMVGVLGMVLGLKLFVGMLQDVMAIDGMQIIKSLGTLVAVFGSFMALLYFTQYAGAHAAKAGIGILAMSAALILIVAAIKLMANVTASDLTKASDVIMQMFQWFALMIAVTKLAGKFAMQAGVMLMATSLAMLMFAGAVVILSHVDPTGLDNAINAVGRLSILFMGLIAVTKLAGSAKNLPQSLLYMGVTIGVMAIALGALSMIDPGKLASATAALTTVMLAFAVMIASTQRIKKKIGGVLGVLITLTVIIAALTTSVYLLAQLPVEQSLGAALGMSVLLLALATSMEILGKCTPLAAKALIPLGLMALVVAALAAILGALEMFDLAPSLDTCIGLSLLLTAMSGSLVVLTAVGMLAGPALTGIGVLMVLIIAMGALIVEIGRLNDMYPELETFLNEGIRLLTLVGEGIGSFFGGMVSGFGTAATSGLPEMADNLANFMTKLQPFIDGVKSIDQSVVSGVNSLAEAFLMLSEADLINWFTGGNSFTQFSEQLGGLGQGLNDFATNIGSFDESTGAKVTAAADAIKALAEAGSTIDGQAEWTKAFVGDNGFGAFGSQLAQLGTDMNTFATNLGEFGDDKVNSVTCACNALKALAEAGNAIPNDGGWAGAIFGENSIGAFGSQLGTVGSGLNAFVTNLGTFNEEQVTSVKCAGEAIKALAEAGNMINGQAEWSKGLFGDNGLAAFSGEFGPLGTNLNTFVTNLGVFTETQVATVKSAVEAIKSFAELGRCDLGRLKSQITGFGDKLGEFATDITTFVTNMPDSAAVDTAVQNLKNMVDGFTGVATANLEAISNFADSMKDLGKNCVDALADSLTSHEAAGEVKAAASEMIGSVIEGADEKSELVSDKFSEIATNGAEAARSQEVYNAFRIAGAYLVTGFANGIRANTYLATARARAMARAAADAANSELEINSPSKVFMRIGGSVPEGFALGIDKLGRLVTASTTSMADGAVNGVKNAMSRVKNAIDSDIDSQPTIRPVLDLSDVTSGANRINDMLSMQPSLATVSNLGSINMAVRRRNQNGANDDVVTAIGKLRKDVGNLENRSYSVGNISYSAGDEVSNAIETLVRAVRVEGRV